MTYEEITQLIDAFRAENEPDSITPDILGQLIQKILDYASDEGVIRNGLQDLIDTRDDALIQIDSAKTEASEEIETAKDEALEEIEEAKSTVDLQYEIIS